MGLKKQDIAKILGISPSMVSKYLAHKRYTKDIETAKKLAEIKGAPIDYIYENLRRVYLRAYPKLSRKTK
jgi:predicted transcriptional regulator